jgi:hypothetical protein
VSVAAIILALVTLQRLSELVLARINTKKLLARGASEPSPGFSPGSPAQARPMVEKAALALSVNEAWALLAGVALIGLLLVPLARENPGH